MSGTARAVPVLLVDDTEANLLALQAVLSSLDIATVTARSGKEALSHVEHEAFAVALVDVQMPEMDGFELMRRLRETRYGRELPVLFVTAVHRNEEYVRKGYSVGGADYITKPYDPQIIRARVKAFIDLYRQREAVNQRQVALRTQERDEAVRRLVALERIATAGLESNDLDVLFSELLAAFVGAADVADSATILLKEGDFLRAAASVGFERDAQSDGRIRIGEGFAGLIAGERRALELNDDAISNVILSPILRDRGLRALYGIPLLHEGQLLGVAYIGSSRAARFSQAETRLFLAAAERASLAIGRRLEISQLSEVLRAAPALIAIVNAADGHYSFVNAPMRALFGQELLGTSHELLGFGGQASLAIAQARRDGATVELSELTVPREMLGERGAMYVRFTAQPLRDANDSIDRVLLFATDVTAEVRARRELEQAELVRVELLERERAARRAAEVASNAKDEFLATISHELRTPLNSILGWASLARSRPSLDIERALSVIERNARAQARIVEDVLDFARMSKGKMQLSLHNVELKEVILSALESVRPAAETKKLELDLELDLNYPVLGDAERLQQVAWNLLSNAVKYTPVGGHVRVTVTSDVNGTRLSIRDSGQGIASDFLPYVFEPFRQADGTTTRRHGGLGLGLAIVRQIVDAHGGTIRAESPGLGLGATFIVELPSEGKIEQKGEAGPPSSTSELERRDAASLRGMRVLLVDDDDDSRELMADTLRLHGADVVQLSSPEAVVPELERTRPHVLVSDIAMPVFDGYELLRRVRALPTTDGGDTPALAVTAYMGRDVLERALNGGFDRYVAKPIDIGRFVSAVAELAKLSVPRLVEGGPTTPGAAAAGPAAAGPATAGSSAIEPG